MMRVTINSKALTEPIPFYLDEGLVGTIASEDESADFLPYKQECFNYLLNNPMMMQMAKDVSREVGLPPEKVLHSMLKGICYVDRKGRKYLNLTYANEEEFAKVWEKFLKSYRAKEELNYLPFIMASALILSIFEANIPKTDYILEPNILQYILPMEQSPEELFGQNPEAVQVTPGMEPTEYGPDGMPDNIPNWDPNEQIDIPMQESNQ